MVYIKRNKTTYKLANGKSNSADFYLLARSVRTKDKVKPEILGYVGTTVKLKKIQEILRKKKIDADPKEIIEQYEARRKK